MNGISEFVQSEPLFETHNHQPGYSRHDWHEVTYREFLGYAQADIEVAYGTGYPDAMLSDEDFFRLWSFVRTTGYGQAVELGVRSLCGCELTSGNAETINRHMREFVGGRTNADVYSDLFARANIIGTVNDVLPADDIGTTLRMDHDDFPASFRFAPRVEGLHAVRAPATVHALEEHLDVSITTLADFEQAIEALVDRAVGQGNVAALKIGLAYQRSLDFDTPGRRESEAAFAALMSGQDPGLKPLHDGLFHHYLQCARERSLVVQIHTGYLAGCWTDLRQGDPSPLVPVFAQYPDVKFDLFHAGWPWSEMLGAIGKHFPNVWLDLCWAWAMNPVQMERILDEWLSAVPSNKILGYGSDTTTPFAVPGYAQQARDGIAAVLEGKLARGEYDKQTARFVARRIMHENARGLFGATSIDGGQR